MNKSPLTGNPLCNISIIRRAALSLETPPKGVKQWLVFSFWFCVGWFESAPEQEKANARWLLGVVAFVVFMGCVEVFQALSFLWG